MHKVTACEISGKRWRINWDRDEDDKTYGLCDWASRTTVYP